MQRYELPTCKSCKLAFPNISHVPRGQCFICSKRTESVRKPRHFPQEMLEWRIVQPNLLYIVGIPSFYDQRKLMTELKQFGEVVDAIFSFQKQYNQYLAYIWFSSSDAVARSIQYIKDLQKTRIYTIKASFGTSKYCAYFLRDGACEVSNCTFIHTLERDRQLVLHSDEEFHKFLQAHKEAVSIREPKQLVNKETQDCRGLYAIYKIPRKTATEVKQKKNTPPIIDVQGWKLEDDVHQLIDWASPAMTIKTKALVLHMIQQVLSQ